MAPISTTALCECRAMDRPKEDKCEHISVRIHGHILLIQGQKRDVTEALGEDYIDWETRPARGSACHRQGLCVAAVRAISRDIHT